MKEILEKATIFGVACVAVTIMFVTAAVVHLPAVDSAPKAVSTIVPATASTTSLVDEGNVQATENIVAEQKKIALTFDDGPHPYYTEQLLEGLKKRGVKATFFVTGEHASLHQEVIERMDDEGHLIGNHTYSHIQLTKTNREQYKEELIATSDVLEAIIGKEIVYVRPPYGSWDKSFEKELNMIPVLWTVDPLDWCSVNVACIAENVISNARENDIILMHDYYESSVTAALKVVDELLEKGFVFVTVEEILFD